MNARWERSRARLEHAALEFNVGSQIHVLLGDFQPMFKEYGVKLQASVERLRELAREERTLTPQVSQEGKNTAGLKKHLRRTYMIRLARVGKRALAYAPGIEKALKVPHARASHGTIVTAAEVMLKTVRPHQKTLLSEGFSKAFFTEFRDYTRELKRIATTSSARQAKFARVSDALEKELATGNEILGILDGLVLHEADLNPLFAKTWKSVMRTPKPLGRPRAKKGKPSA